MTPGARAIVATLLALLFVTFCAIGWLSWRQAKTERERRIVAEQGQALAVETGAITERTLRTEIVVHHQAEEQVDAVQSAPGADAPLDPAFRDRLRAGFDVLRRPAEAADDRGSGSSS